VLIAKELCHAVAVSDGQRFALLMWLLLVAKLVFDVLHGAFVDHRALHE
jgi:hypothetical protein